VIASVTEGQPARPFIHQLPAASASEAGLAASVPLGLDLWFCVGDVGVAAGVPEEVGDCVEGIR
jgi:hypothetical protein